MGSGLCLSPSLETKAAPLIWEWGSCRLIPGRCARHEIARAELQVILPPVHPLGAKRTITAADLAPYRLITYTIGQGLAPIANGVFVYASRHKQKLRRVQ